MHLSRIAKAIAALFGLPVTSLIGNLEEVIRTGAAMNWKLQAIVMVGSAWTAFLVWAMPNTPSGAAPPA